MFARITAVCILGLSLAACTTDQITLTLGALVDAGVAAATIVDPSALPILNEVSACVSDSTTILDSTANGINKAGQIASACASAVAATNNAPVGLQAVAAALKTFMNAVSAIATAQLEPSLRNEGFNVAVNSFMGADAKGKPTKINHAKMVEIKVKAEKLRKILASRK